MNEKQLNPQKTKRRKLGIHLTSSDIFEQYIFPEISDIIYDFLWTDLFCGEGNLLFPILEKIPKYKRSEYFREHIFLSDIQEKMIQICKKKALSLGISHKLIENNIIASDNLANFPKLLKNKKYPIYHITNPPYLYLGYIQKNEDTQSHLKYFTEKNKGYQDLYQIAMMNDLRERIDNLIYIIPSNFLFGASVSNKFRNDFLKFYDFRKIITFETKIFEHTGTNILIGFFKRKKTPSISTLEFSGKKVKKNKEITLNYHLNPKYNFRAGTEFNEFLENFHTLHPLKVNYYLKLSDIEDNRGNNQLDVIDSSKYRSGNYLKKKIYVNKELFNTIKSNVLFVKTVDSGSFDGRAGLYEIKESFKVDGILVSGNTYRTSPIHLFLEPILSIEDQNLLKKYFNFVLEHFRKLLDSEFLTTYKYSNAEYTRKYLGLRQVRKLIKTFPILDFRSKDKALLTKFIEDMDFDKIRSILEEFLYKSS